MNKSTIRNPQLEGDPFYWEGGPTGILLIHGYTATTAEVRLLACYLYERGYSVAGPLLPGHYTIPEDANRYRWQDWARAVEETYRQLAGRCERVIVGGESTGALLALNLASEHPEAAAILAYAPALQLQLSRAAVARLYLAAPFVPYIRKGQADDLPWQGYAVYPLRGAIELLRLQREVRRRLPGIQQPILIVQGKLDPTVDPHAPETIYKRVRSTVKELHWMEHSAHCVCLDCEWEEIAAMTAEFVEKVLDRKRTTAP